MYLSYKPLRYKPLPAIIALLLCGCGNGGQSSAGPQGDTAKTQLPISTTSANLLACVDNNHNWQCDDGDASLWLKASGATGLTPAADEYTLLETRDASNRRTSLLISELGSGQVDGASTLRTALQKAKISSSQIDKTLALTTSAQLESGFASSIKTYPSALGGIEAYSLALEKQGIANPQVPSFNPGTGSSSQVAQWYGPEPETTRRQLTAQGSTVLNNSESNRLYVFDAETSPLANVGVATHEIDLIPNDAPLIANSPKWARPLLRGLAAVVNVLIDTASAATGFSSAPSTGSAVVLPPGQGIAGIQLLNQGREALVLMNMLDDRFNQEQCQTASQGTEGLFRIELQDKGSYRQLEKSQACVHSNFSLMASDSRGEHIAAWDAKAQKLWLLDGATMQATQLIEIGFDSDKPPQALALSAGGRYLAAVGYGRVAMVDLEQGKVLTQFAGSAAVGTWGNVAQASFAAGSRRLLIASGQEVHSLAFDDSLHLLEHTSNRLTGASETLRGLSVSADGDTYAAVSDSQAYWASSGSNSLITSIALPPGLTVQQAAAAHQQLFVMARGAQDQQFKILRVPLAFTATLFATR
ncbi:MAG: hypothetical protein RL497_2488 [Pseudomonadota bacterium]|jgi:hypothetical protein